MGPRCRSRSPKRLFQTAGICRCLWTAGSCRAPSRPPHPARRSRSPQKSPRSATAPIEAQAMRAKGPTAPWKTIVCNKTCMVCIQGITESKTLPLIYFLYNFLQTEIGSFLKTKMFEAKYGKNLKSLQQIKIYLLLKSICCEV